MRATVALVAVAAPAAALLVVACTSTTSPPGAMAADACSAQTQAFTLPGVRITEAMAVESNTVRPAGVTTGALLVAHCKLTGRLNERVGADGKPYHIGFELRLPRQWNGRFLYQGGGGNDGVVRPAVGPQAAPGYALNRGFAVVTTDAGHQGPDASFGFDPIARVDNAYNAHDKVAVTAKEIVRRFYARPAERSYFIGCSGGGRQGMMFTQRFPTYFDGVIAMAPAMRVSKGATIAAAWDTQALAAIAPQGADRKPMLSQALGDAELALLRKGILDACDAQDGIVDGLVSNPAACRFDPRQLMCEGGKNTDCLTTLQVGALKKIFAGPTDSGGRKLYFGWPWDPGVGHPQNDWRLWKLGNSTTAAPNSRHVVLMQDALQGYFVTPPDRSLSVFNFDFDRDPARLDAHAWIFNTADDVDLAGFRARGGKLLFAHGLADPIFSPEEMIDYYQRLNARHGAATTEFARLFLIPGMGHCQGGAATDSWDGLGALMDWVEKGQAPQRIVATGTVVFPGRTRPLCAYPAHAHYDGGNAEDASSFSCRAP
jgi:pimeloyl-ACP methyl ester carboxylesterase